MSMLKYTLHDFIANVPSCVQTTRLSTILGIFNQGQCERVVVVSEQQCPIGVLYPSRLIPQLMSSYHSGGTLDVQQPLYELGAALVEPIATLPAELSLEQFRFYLRSQQSQTNTGSDWALIDSSGKFLGLLDSVNLLQFLALSPPTAMDTDERDRLGRSPRQPFCESGETLRSVATERSLCESGETSARDRPPTPQAASRKHRVDRSTLDLLVQLLERLPLPLMLQTATGEIVTQNPAWWQQFGSLSDPELVIHEVEAILQTCFIPQVESLGHCLQDMPEYPKTNFSGGLEHESGVRINASCPTEMLGVNIVHSSSFQGYQQRGHLNEAKLNQPSFYPSLTEAGEKKASFPAPLPLPQADALPPALKTAIPTPTAETGAYSSSRCQLGTQPGTCICVFSVQNGQERVWQFVKIPLQGKDISLQELGVKSQHSEGKDSGFWILDSGSSCVLSTDLWLLLATDVTEQQQLASELAAKNADLIHLNRLKDEFLACISHELKTPLTAVLGLSTLLKNQALGQLNERQARYARLIHESGRHLMTVVNDILDLTRMETGQLKLTLEPVYIATVVRSAIEQARAIQPKTSQPSRAGEPLAESPGDHRFTLLIEPGLDSIVADELRLRQMLIHLLSNAFKFTEASGEIGLRVNRWEGWIAFTVWDTGIGIPEHQQHLIFQKFQQLENPLTRQFEGTGLGLVLTRALARLHGGDVSFLSKEGKGSEFTLLLPPSPPNKRAGEQESTASRDEGALRAQRELFTKSVWMHTSSPASPAFPSLKSPTLQTHHNCLVLIVEAAPRFIEDLTEQLTNLGYRVVIARSGTEALEKTRRLQPKAVFLNPLLPLLSGWDVLTLLKSDAATRQIPVIVTATRAEKNQAFSNRADEFVSLPVQQQVLQQVLAHFCTTPPVSQSDKGVSQSAGIDTPLTILRLSQNSGIILDSSSWLLNSGVLHQHHYRVLEADDLEQAELLARVWQPDVVLLDGAIPEPLTYLKQLSQHSNLKGLPLVTLDAATTQAANQVSGLSVFPCLTPVEKLNTDALLPVLQIAAGMSCKPSILLVDFTTLPDLQEERGVWEPHSSLSLRSEWFQALIQYLQTAGLRAVMGRSWAEVLQQIRQQSVDLLLICLGDLDLDVELHPGVLAALTALDQQHDLPPVLVLEQRLSQGKVREQFSYYEDGNRKESSPTPQETSAESDAVKSLETVLGAIATKILPHSLSMEELLDHIHQTLSRPGTA